MASAFPSDNQVRDFLIDAKVLEAGSSLPASLAGVSETARKIWERDTGYSPWIATTQTRYFDPPQGTLLELGAGLLAVTSLKVDIQYDADGNVKPDSGKVLQQNVDYYLLPLEAPSVERPFTMVEFKVARYGEKRTIEIVGSWGWGSGANAVPQDAFDAVLRLAALFCLPTLQELKGSLKSVRQGDLAYDYGGIDREEITHWRTFYQAAVDRYRRWGL